MKALLAFRVVAAVAALGALAVPASQAPAASTLAAEQVTTPNLNRPRGASARADRPQRTQGNEASFSDATGDAVASADIATVAVSSDDLGVLTFQIVFAAKPSHTSPLVVYIDSDRNAATGDPARVGADYFVQPGYASDLSSFRVGRWDGTQFKDFSFSVENPEPSGVVQTFSFDSYYLGRTTGFNFFVTTEIGDGASILDRAPDVGQPAWSFDMKVTPVRISVARLTTRPKHPRAGHTFAASLLIKASARVDLGRILNPSCKARAGTKPLSPTQRFPEWVVFPDKGTSTVKCTWRIPPRAGGQLLRGSVAVSFHGRRLARSFSAKIAP
jgi:hypothetical protein